MATDYVTPRRAAAQLADLPDALQALARRLGQTRRRVWQLELQLVASKPRMQCVLHIDEDRLHSVHPWYADAFATPVRLLAAFDDADRAYLMPEHARTLLPGCSPMTPADDETEEDIRERERERVCDGTVAMLEVRLANNSSWVPRGLWDLPTDHVVAPPADAQACADELDTLKAQQRTLELTLLTRLCELHVGDVEQVQVTAVWGIARLWTPELQVNVAADPDEVALPAPVRATQDLIAELDLHHPLAPWDEVFVDADGAQVVTRSGMNSRWMGAALSQFAPELA